MRNAKTHYVTLRIIFDKPVDKKLAARLAKDAMLRQKISTVTTRTEQPSQFTVAKVISA